MLRYKFSLNNKNKGNEIPYERLYYGLNGNFVTFKTHASSSLRDGQEIKVACIRKGELIQSQLLKASVKTVTEQGYILYNRRYYLEKSLDNTYILRFEDGKYYSTLSLNGGVEGQTITINALDYCSSTEHTIKSDGGVYYIEVPIKYYVYDGIITIDNKDFEVDFSEIKSSIKSQLNPNQEDYWIKNNYEVEYSGKLTVDIFNMTAVVYDSDPPKWRNVQLVTLLKRDDFNLALDEITCADVIYSFNYEHIVDGVIKNDIHFFEKNKAKIKPKNETDTDDEENNDDFETDGEEKNDDYKLVTIYDDDGIEPIKYFKKEYYEAVECTSGGTKILNGKIYNIDYAYTDNTFGKYLNLYLESQDFNPPLGTKIYATPLNGGSIREVSYEVVGKDESNNDIAKKCLYIGGERYWVDDEPHYYILINGVEYLLTKVQNKYVDKSRDEKYDNSYTQGYYYFIRETDTMPTYVKVADVKAVDEKTNEEITVKKAYYTDSRLSKELGSFTVIERSHINIKGVPYKVYDAVPRYVWDVESDKTYEMIGLNEHIIYEDKETVTLVVIDKRSDNLVTCAVVSDDYDDSTAYSIASNYNSYVFSLSNSILPSTLYDKDGAMTRANGLDAYDPLEVIMYDESQTIKIPIALSNKGAVNLHQEEIVENEFVEKEIGERMNRIVDMEKDIYYPVVKDNTTDKYLDVNEIKFHLHFRERSSDWKIIEDGGWNVLNYDNASVMPQGTYHKPQVKPKFQYYQDSDLLCFLGFSDSDVFYQKQKISKSFLRISFFDSNNPKTQSLLYTATIFMNENALYKTYIDNMDDKANKEWVDILVPNNLTILKNISVNAEPKGSNDNARLDATLSIKNKYEAEESSEGFYLYIFREYSTNLRPRKIYMKVDFNHAGIGKTLAFFIPNKTDSDYKYGYTNNDICSDFTSSEIEPMEWDEIKGANGITDGIPLSELYKKLFIPLNVQYDDKSQRYIYFFDKNFTQKLYDEKGNLHLNLYELKIKDES